MIAPRRTRALALTAGLVALAIAGFLALHRPPLPQPPPPPEALDADIATWCADGVLPIAGGGCLAVPADVAKPVPLLLYLHGRYSPKTLAEEHERQRRVARLGTSKGYAVLAMRGVQGECTPQELADTWCWPSNSRNAQDGRAFYERFEPALREARARLGRGRTVLLGFSNGAYFSALIATRALGAFDAIAIAHGGPVPPTHAEGAMPPLLLITADDDPSDGEMQQLHAELTRERWLHELVGREGGHALPDWDVLTALTFFERVRQEHLPLVPPLQAPRARRPAEAGVEEPPMSEEDAD